MRAVITCACVLGLDGVDKGAIGAMARPLQHAFGIGRTDLGLLLTASVSTTALAAFVSATWWIGLGAVNPPLDAARLDIMPAGLWGRAESVRSFLQKCGEAAAPVLFGYAADQTFGGGAGGLHDTLLVMLIPLGGAGVLAWFARRAYLRDVATARASDRKA